MRRLVRKSCENPALPIRVLCIEMSLEFVEVLRVPGRAEIGEGRVHIRSHELAWFIKSARSSGSYCRSGGAVR